MLMAAELMEFPAERSQAAEEEETKWGLLGQKDSEEAIVAAEMAVEDARCSLT